MRRDDAAEVATKLELNNTRYVVVKRLAQCRYFIRHLHTGKEKVAHIDKIARMRLCEASKSEEPPYQVAVDALTIGSESVSTAMRSI